MAFLHYILCFLQRIDLGVDGWVTVLRQLAPFVLFVFPFLPNPLPGVFHGIPEHLLLIFHGIPLFLPAFFQAPHFSL